MVKRSKLAEPIAAICIKAHSTDYIGDESMATCVHLTNHESKLSLPRQKAIKSTTPPSGGLHTTSFLWKHLISTIINKFKLYQIKQLKDVIPLST